jgi:hypothetical protein
MPTKPAGLEPDNGFSPRLPDDRRQAESSDGNPIARARISTGGYIARHPALLNSSSPATSASRPKQELAQSCQSHWSVAARRLSIAFRRFDCALAINSTAREHVNCCACAETRS